MSGAIPWKTLETQFFENSIYQDEISKLIVSPEDVSQHIMVCIISTIEYILWDATAEATLLNVSAQ